MKRILITPLILDSSLWLWLTYFLADILFWLIKCFFSNDGDTINQLPQSITEYTFCYFHCSNQPSWKIHSVAIIIFDCFTIAESNQVIQAKSRSTRTIFFKIALGMKLIELRNKTYYQEKVFGCFSETLIFRKFQFFFSISFT